MKTRNALRMIGMAAAMWATTAIGGFPELPLVLGTAGDFVVLAKSGITGDPAPDITGDMGVSPIAASAITGFALVMDGSGTFSTSAYVDGKIYATDYTPPTPTKMSTAISDMETAYTTAAGRTTPDTTEFMSGDISGQTITPGLHKWSTQVLINTDVWLDAQGDADAIFIFQIAGNLTMASSQEVILMGGAQAKNIFWQVGGGAGAVIGTYSHFEGIILSATKIDLLTGASFNGKLLAQTAVNLQGNLVMDADDIPPPEVQLEIISAHGTGTPATGVYINVMGTLLTNSVTAFETLGGTQYVNTGWSMIGNVPEAGLTNSMTMVHTNDAVLTWLWSTNHLLDASADGNGTVAGDTNGFYAAGSSVTVTATPSLGYQFTGWSGDVGGAPTNDAALTLTMDQARTVVAHFSGATSNLTLTVISEHGVGEPLAGLPPAGLVYTNEYGATLTNFISAMEQNGGTQYVNTGWAMTGNGPETGLTNSMSMVITNDAVLTWLWSTNYLLAASAVGNGTVAGDTNGFYVAGSSVTVTATPSLGDTFQGWSGDVGGAPTNDAALTLTMDQARTVVAHFSGATSNLTLTVISEHGVGEPLAGLPPAGLVYTNEYGATLTNFISAMEQNGGTQYVNTGWAMTGNGPETGLTNSMTMVITNDAVLTWLWSTNYLLAASAAGNGTVAGDTNGFYVAGSSVTVTATPSLGDTFQGWTGDVGGAPTNDAALTLTMDQARTVVAHFSGAASNLTLTVISAHGVGEPLAGLPPAGLVYTNEYGATLTNFISAMEQNGGTQYVNTGWAMTGNGPEAGLTNSMSMVITNDAVLTWQWSTNYLLAASAAANGTVAGDTNGFYVAGSSVTVTATPSFGYQFTGWSGDVGGAPTNDAALTLTMDQARTVVAHFSALFIDVTGLVDWSVIWVFDPRTGYFTGTLTISNRVDSEKSLLAPFWFEVESTEWHWLRYPTGIDTNTGLDYLDISAAVNSQLPGIGDGDMALDPGESVTVGGIQLMGRRTPTGLVVAVWADPPAALSIPVDTDGDGMSDVDEQVAGTSATDPNSVFLIRLGGPDGRSVQWDSQPDRLYKVLISTDLRQGFVVAADNIEGTGTPATFTATAPASGNGMNGAVFFRVEVRMK